jgi:outer membrane immunogenic protein
MAEQHGKVIRIPDLDERSKGASMKRFVFAIALCLGAGAAAQAADLPPAPMPPPRAPAAYVPAPIPYYNWTGFYLGGNLGYGFGGSGASDTAKSSITTTTSQSFLGGGQAGFNWEFGSGS